MSSTLNEIVITGAGLVSPLGLNCQQTWQSILDGRAGMRPLTALESMPAGGNAWGGQAPDLPADFAPQLPREVRYLRWAMADAWRDAGLEDSLPYSPARCALLMGTTLHGMRAAGRYFRNGDHGEFRHFLASSIAANLRSTPAWAGFTATVCSACSSSLGSIAMGITLLQSGQADLVVAGGYDTISEYVYGGFMSLRVVTDGPLRPFARERRGMKLAEGYAVVILERGHDAAERGAKVLARILGWGESADAHHLTQPHPQGDGAATAVRQAMERAKLSPTDVDMIAAHATGTNDNDASERAAFARVMGAGLGRVPIVAFKSHLGHTLGAAGAVELILSAMALRDQIVPACANIRAEDVEFDDLTVATGAARPATLRATLNTSLGFGGANTCVILGHGTPTLARAGAPLTPSPGSPGEGRGEGLLGPTLDLKGNPTAPNPHPNPLPEYRERGKWAKSPVVAPAAHDVFITGIGVVLPGAVGNDALIARLRANDDGSAVFERDVHAVAPSDFEGLLQARRVRRMAHYVKLTLAATTLAFRDAGIADLPLFAADCAAVLGSTHGCSSFSTEYYQQIVGEGLAAANPSLFAEAVPNAAAAQLSLMLSLRGACQTVIGSRTAGLDALALAALRIRSGLWDRAVVSAGEEICELVHAAYRHCGLARRNISGSDSNRNCAPQAGLFGEQGFAIGEGAVTFILESHRSLEARGGHARGRIIASAACFGDRAHAAKSAQGVLDQLAIPAVISSACGTWVDRSEWAALRRWEKARPVSAIYGHFAETFSASPLIAIAAGLLIGRLPPLFGNALGDERVTAVAGAPAEADSTFATICTDFDGGVSGVGVTRLND